MKVHNKQEGIAREITRLEARQTKLLPLYELRARLDELPKNAEIVTFCQTSVRAYQAQRILEGAGFKNVVFMDGSIAAWPYEVLTTSEQNLVSKYGII